MKPFVIASTIALSTSVNAAVLIDFETSTHGYTLPSYATFSQTTPLSELYAPWGIHFEPYSENAIINGVQTTVASGSVLSAESFQFGGNNDGHVLAFNSLATGYVQTISFDSGAGFVDLFAATDGYPNRIQGFSVSAFDASDSLIGVKEFGAITTNLFDGARIGFNSADDDIYKVVIEPYLRYGGTPENYAYYFDNLTVGSYAEFKAVPLPGALGLFLAALAGLSGRATMRRCGSQKR